MTMKRANSRAEVLKLLFEILLALKICKTWSEIRTYFFVIYADDCFSSDRKEFGNNIRNYSSNSARFH